jgi:CHAT domain-containing protein
MLRRLPRHAGVLSALILATGALRAQPGADPIERFLAAPPRERARLVAEELLQTTDRLHELLHRATRAAGSAAASDLEAAALAWALAADAELGSQLASEVRAILATPEALRRDRAEVLLAVRRALAGDGDAPRAIADLAAFAREHGDAEAYRAALLHRLRSSRGRIAGEARHELLQELLRAFAAAGLEEDELALLAHAELWAAELRRGVEPRDLAPTLRSLRGRGLLARTAPPTRAQLLSLEAELQTRQGFLVGAEATLRELEPLLPGLAETASRDGQASFLDLVAEWWRQVALVRAQLGAHAEAARALAEAARMAGIGPRVRARLLVAQAREALAAGDLAGVEAIQPGIRAALAEARGAGGPEDPLLGQLAAQAAIVRAEAWIRRGQPDRAGTLLEAHPREAGWPRELAADHALADGLRHCALGRLDTAVLRFQAALAALPADSASPQRATAHIGLARTLLALGEADAADLAIQRARSAASATHHDRALLVVLSAIGHAHVELSRRRPEQAESHLEEARTEGARVLQVRRDLLLETIRLGLEARWQQAGFSGAPASSLVGAARTAIERVRTGILPSGPAEAAECLRLHELWQEIELAAHGPVEDPAAAARALWREISETRDLSPSAFEWNEARSVLYAILGRLAEAQGRVEDSVRHYRDAAALEGALRGRLRDRVPDALSCRFEGLHDRLLGQVLHLAAETGSPAWTAESIATLEALRAQSLRTLLGSRHRAGLDLAPADGGPGPEDPGSPLPALDRSPDRAVLAYSVTSRGVFVVAARGAERRVVRLPVSAREIERRVHALVSNLHGEPDAYSGPALAEDAAALHAALVAPVAVLLEGARELVIVPDGPLHALPFGVLAPAAAGGREHPAPCEVLAAKPGLESLVMAPSLAVLELLTQRREPRPEGQVLVLGPPEDTDPGRAPLLAAEAEAGVWARAFPAGLCEWRRGPAAAIAGGAPPPGRFRILHILTHAESGARRGAWPRLVLHEHAGGPGSLVGPEDIARLDLEDVDLVVLAACGTASGPSAGLEGELGLPRAFLVAGARSVLATLGPVRDRASHPLLKALAAEMAADRRASPARALNRAVRSLLAGPETRWPGLWAPYVLIGAP